MRFFFYVFGNNWTASVSYNNNKWVTQWIPYAICSCDGLRHKDVWQYIYVYTVTLVCIVCKHYRKYISLFICRCAKNLNGIANLQMIPYIIYLYSYYTWVYIVNMINMCQFSILVRRTHPALGTILLYMSLY